MQYIINNESIVFFHGGKPVKVEKSASEYNRIIACFDLPEDQQDDAISELINKKVGEFEQDVFSIKPSQVTYDGERLPTALAEKVRSIAMEGLPVKLFKKFWDSLQNNPSANSVRQLYDFLSYKELPITEDGCFLAYKGVNRDGWSCHGNINTKVLQGDVDSRGRIKNEVGNTVEVLRRDVDDERSNHCSFGLHVGSLDYAESFSNGRVLIVKINPADVVSVPNDCSCQKCRVSKYEIVDSYDTEIKSAVCDADGNPILSEVDEEANELVDRIENYLSDKRAIISPMEDVISIQRIQNIFSPEYPSKVRVLDALTSLGEVWYQSDDDGKYYVELY
jgi:hypothetical protein